MNAGYKTLGLSCAGDLYKKLEEAVPDLCLVDIMLPDESGNDIVKKLRRDTIMDQVWGTDYEGESWTGRYRLDLM